MRDRIDVFLRCTGDENPHEAAIGTRIVTLHMGFLPRDPADPVYEESLEVLARAWDFILGTAPRA